MKNIKLVAVTAFLCACYLQVCAQTSISNVWVEGQNRKIAVHYTLVAGQPTDVDLQYSTDNGSAWFFCKSITGDLLSQATGDRTIIWDCLQDGYEKGSLLFKVIANESHPVEKTLTTPTNELSFPTPGTPKPDPQEEQNKQNAIKYLQRANSTFSNSSLGNVRFDQSFQLYMDAKKFGGDVSTGYNNFLSIARLLIENGAEFDENVKKMLQYAQQLNDTQEVRDLLNKCK